MLPLLVALATDPVPEDKDVVAGWTALVVFLVLAVAVAVIGWALTGSLRRARANADKGVFDSSVAPADDATHDASQ